MASLIGFLMLMLWFGSSHSLFLDLWVQKVSITVPPAKKWKIISVKQLVKDRAASFLCMSWLWYTAVGLESRWRGRACSSWGWHQKSPISWVVPLQLWHHCPRGTTSSHVPWIAWEGWGMVLFFPLWTDSGLFCSVGKRGHLDYSFHTWGYFFQNREY